MSTDSMFKDQTTAMLSKKDVIKFIQLGMRAYTYDSYGVTVEDIEATEDLEFPLKVTFK